MRKKKDRINKELEYYVKLYDNKNYLKKYFNKDFYEENNI